MLVGGGSSVWLPVGEIGLCDFAQSGFGDQIKCSRYDSDRYNTA
jgi:hypothetical protein